MENIKKKKENVLEKFFFSNRKVTLIYSSFPHQNVALIFSFLLFRLGEKAWNLKKQTVKSGRDQKYPPNILMQPII